MHGGNGCSQGARPNFICFLAANHIFQPGCGRAGHRAFLRVSAARLGKDRGWEAAPHGDTHQVQWTPTLLLCYFPSGGGVLSNQCQHYKSPKSLKISVRDSRAGHSSKGEQLGRGLSREIIPP